MTTNPYELADEATLNEIVREAESLLAAQLQVAIAADQRALTFSGLLVAGVGAMIGIATSGDRPTLWLAIIATLLGLAAAAALVSARPTRWCFAGTEPFQWQADLIDESKTLHRSMAEMAAHYDGALRRNHRALRAAAWAMRGSLMLTAIALAVAIVATWTVWIG